MLAAQWRSHWKDRSLTGDTTADLSFEQGQALRLRTLVRLRWLAVAGQTAAVLSVHLVFGFPLPLGWCLAVIALSAWLNIFFTIRWRSSVRLSAQFAGLLLAYDILQLAALLYLTGGLENPFAFLFLVPVTVSATSLSLRWTLSLGVIAFACATFLAVSHLPLPWYAGQTLQLPQLYVGGMWAAILCGVVFSAIYARHIAEEARQMSTALTAAEQILAREQRLSALDGLAAAAAHELGTPLATIALVAKELKRELPAERPACRGYRSPDRPGGALPRNSLAACQSRRAGRRDVRARQADGDDRGYRRAVARHRHQDPWSIRAPSRRRAQRSPPNRSSRAIRRSPTGSAISSRTPSTSPKPKSRSRRAGPRAMSRSRSAMTGRASRRRSSTGSAIPSSPRGPAMGRAVTTSEAELHAGMGLGFFIAKTLLERSGATVSLANKPFPDHGAMVRIAWPRAVIDLAGREACKARVTLRPRRVSKRRRADV